MTKKTSLKKHLLASASVLAMGAFAGHQASAAVLTSGAAPAASDTPFTITSSVNITSGTIADNTTPAAAGVIQLDSAFVLTLTGATASHTNNNNAGPTIATVTGSTTATGITNAGTIQNLQANASSRAIKVGTVAGTISNTGSVTVIGTGIGVEIAANLTLLSNGAAGIIQAATGSAVATSAAVSAAITNGASGTTNSSIQATGDGNAILITGGTLTGDITNWGSLISAGTTGSTKATLNVLSTVAGNVYNKAGATMSNSAAGAAAWLGANISGTDGFSNAGTITATAASAAAFGVNAAFAGTIALITNASTGSILANGGGGSAVNITNGTTVTALTNNGTIQGTAGNGVLIATGGNITTLTNNALINDATNGVGLSFAGTSAATTVVNAGTISTTGAGTGILTAGAVTSSGVAITNSGSITTTTGRAISIATGALTGTSATGAIYNTSTGKIQATTGGSAGVVSVTGVALVNNTTNVASTGASAGLYNAGLINDGNNGIGLLLSTAGATYVSNVSGGTISTTGAGTAVSITGGAVTGTFFNGGSITSTTGTGMLVTGVALSKLNNVSTGIISTTGGNAIALATTGAITDLTNAGTIQDTSTGAALNFTGSTGVTAITNTGVIKSATTTQSPTTGTIKVDADSGSVTITNSAGGSISSTGGGIAIAFTNAASRLGLVSNSGTISASTSSLNAIDFSTATAGSATVTNNATGLITGNILTGITAGADTITLKGVNTSTTTSTIGLNGNIVFGLASDIVSFEQAAGSTQYYGGTIKGASSTEKGILNAVTGLTYLTATGTGAHTLASSTVSSGATLTFAAATTTTSTMSGTMTVNGTLVVGDKNALTLTTGLSQATSGVVTIGVKNTATTMTYGSIGSAASTNSFLGGAGAITVDFSSSSTAYTPTSTLLTSVVTGTGGLTWTVGGNAVGTIDTITTAGVITAGTNSARTLTDNSYTLDFKAYTRTGTATTIDILATRANTYQSSSSLVNEKAVGAALEAVANNGNDALDTVHGVLDSYATAAQVEGALKTLDATTQTSGATTQATLANQDAAIGTVESRMEVARNEMSGSGVATGGRMNNSGVWGEVYGSAIDQDWRKGVDGYEANLGGFAIGADTAINSQTRLGAAFAYGRTEAEGVRQEVDVDSFQGSVYGTYDMGKIYYEGLAAFTYNNYETTRTLFSNNGVATADFDGQQYSAKATAGYKVDVQGGLKVTPFVSAQYTFLTQDDYSEIGSNAPLHVEADDINIFKTGLGTKLAYPIVDGGITYTPRLSAAWYYDLVGEEVETSSYFTSASGTRFISKGADIAQSAFKFGAGLDVLSQDNVTVSLDYNWDTKEEYNSHSGAVKARFEF